MTIALVAANAITFAITSACGVTTPEDMVAVGGNYAPLTLGGEPWRLLTSIFLHNDLEHIAVNMLALLLGGATAERWFGRAGFLTLYLLAGLAGGVAIASFEDGSGVGASGAVYGVLGAIGASLVLRRDRLGRAGPPMLLLGGLLLAGLVVGPSSSVPGPASNPITWAAHLTGLLAGMGLGAALAAGRPAHRGRRAAWVGGLALGAVIVALAVMPKPVDRGRCYQEAYDDYARVQREVALAYNAVTAEVRAGRLDDAGFAAAIEQDTLPPWRALTARMKALEVPPPPYRDCHLAMLAFVEARLTSFVAIDDLLRGRRTDGAQVNALRLQAEAALAALQVETRKLPQ